MSKCITLVGIKHSGKTTKGIHLAKQLNVPFFDIDNIIEQQTGKTCRELFSQEGFEAFQTAELTATKYIIEEQNKIIAEGSVKAIISTGGGICENKLAIELLSEISTVVNIAISFDTAFDRIVKKSYKTGSFPPMLGVMNVTPLEEIKNNFEKQYNERTQKYLDFSNITIDTDTITKEQVCNKIIEEINS